MAGHSKWANIRHKKAKEDAKRSKVFSKHIKEITVAAREGGGDPEGNPRLSLAIDNAKADNVPKDNIERAIKRGTGEDTGGASYEEATFEGYGPGGIAYFIEVTTDNNNRTVGELRHIFTKSGGNMGTTGSVGYMFEQKGMIRVHSEGLDDEEFMLEAIDAGAADVDTDDEMFVVYTSREELFDVRNRLEEAGFEIESATLIREAVTETKVDADIAVSNLRMMEKFEDNDDVNNVFTNMLMDDETIALAEEI
ncbi:MAG: YebC/PmpR family DNA-binding transcriptional regulator [Gracilimonas sp.]|uniref:YebC/PmpR family DNA-binding transcriptional regulator n=1 Tax=Gracilimonas sp. TaxID=1974203 RepID=UPI003750C10C|nr:YebC/PmpR family DNA-binding transcriptional regulator [Gracilimonas sp.]